MEKYTYEGEKFLSMLYSDLHLKESVINSSNINDKKLEKIKKYLDRQETIHKKALNKSKLDLLKKAYYDKYVIKEVPKEYIEFLDKNNFNEKGLHLTKEEIKKQENLILENQKKSLDAWINYLVSEEAKFYPWWAKYWVLQGILKIGAYDNKKETYGERTSKTVAPFIELNRELLSKSLDLVMKEVKGEKLEETQKELISKKSFAKVYIELLKNQKNTNRNNKDTEGIWIKYEQGDDYIPLLEAVEQQNTGWCTAGEEICKKQINNGDFYIYFTKDEKGEYKVPRIAIRMDGKDKIGEIKGIDKCHNIEPHLERVLDKKLNEFIDKDAYKQRINDSQILTYIYTKYENKKMLTKEDLSFIYEIDRKIESFGYYEDPRIGKIKENRNPKKDLALIFDCKEEEVALTQKELQQAETTEVFLGNLEYRSLKTAENIKIPRIILGDVNLPQLETSEGLEKLEVINGYADFYRLKNSEGLKNLKKIDKDAIFSSLENAKGLENLETIGEDAYFEELTNAKGLKSLKSIGGNAEFEKLKNIEGLENLEKVNESIEELKVFLENIKSKSINQEEISSKKR